MTMERVYLDKRAVLSSYRLTWQSSILSLCGLCNTFRNWICFRPQKSSRWRHGNTQSPKRSTLV